MGLMWNRSLIIHLTGVHIFTSYMNIPNWVRNILKLLFQQHCKVVRIDIYVFMLAFIFLYQYISQTLSFYQKPFSRHKDRRQKKWFLITVKIFQKKKTEFLSVIENTLEFTSETWPQVNHCVWHDIGYVIWWRKQK